MSEEQSSASQKALLDKTWERIQKKTFTGWVNTHIRKKGHTISEIEKEINDGLKLIALLEVISGEDPFPYKYDKKPNMRVKQVGNLGVALKFVQEKGVKLVGIGPEDICDGNLKLILGLIWTIILRFQIQDISMEDLSAKEGLLRWCQRKTEGYKDVKVENFHFSFQDGLALCALIHRHRPDLLDYSKCDKNNKAENLQKAFDVAAKYLDIPQLMDVADIVDVVKPDERSMMTYVSMLYHVFSKNQEAELAGGRIGKIVDFAQEIEKAKNNYIHDAGALKDWINTTDNSMKSPNFDNTFEGVQGKIGEFSEYRTKTKKEKGNEKFRLEELFSSINTKLAINNRPAFVAPAGLSPTDIDVDWRKLGKTEHEYNLALIAELRRQQQIKDLLQQFNLRTEKLKAWAKSKEEYLNSTNYGNSVSTCEQAQRDHELFYGEYEASNSRLQTINDIRVDLEKLGYSALPTLDAELGAINSLYAGLVTKADDKKHKIEEELARQKKMEAVLLTFAKDGLRLNLWLEGAEETLKDPINADSFDAVNFLNEKHNQFTTQVQEKEQELQALRALAGQAKEWGKPENLFGSLTLANIEKSFADVQALIGEKKNRLAHEYGVQQANDELCKRYAGLVQPIVSFILEKTNQLGQCTTAEQVRTLSKDIAHNQAQVDAAANLASEIVSKGILENKHTDVTFDSLKTDWEGLIKKADLKAGDIEKEALAKEKNSKLPAEQLSELRECFSSFDKDNDQYLSRLEFGSCLKALGHDVSLEEGGSLDQLIDKINPANRSAITFDEFVRYMEDIQSHGDTPDSIKAAFGVIAGGKDFITEADLRTVMPEEKVAYLIANMPKYPGQPNAFDYKGWTDTCYV